MERFCFLIYLRPGQECEYRRRHEEIWPELKAAIEAAGIRNYTLFRRDTEVVAYCECHPDASTSFAQLAQSEVNGRWSAWFEDVIEAIDDGAGNLLTAEEVWHLD